jgi:hypothetical protein
MTRSEGSQPSRQIRRPPVWFRDPQVWHWLGSVCFFLPASLRDGSRIPALFGIQVAGSLLVVATAAAMYWMRRRPGDRLPLPAISYSSFKTKCLSWCGVLVGAGMTLFFVALLNAHRPNVGPFGIGVFGVGSFVATFVERARAIRMFREEDAYVPEGGV